MKRALAALSGIGLILVACGGDDTATSTLPRVSETVPLGDLPEPPTETGPLVTPATIAPPTTVPEPESCRSRPRSATWCRAIVSS